QEFRATCSVGKASRERPDDWLIGLVVGIRPKRLAGGCLSSRSHERSPRCAFVLRVVSCSYVPYLALLRHFLGTSGRTAWAQLGKKWRSSARAPISLPGTPERIEPHVGERQGRPSWTGLSVAWFPSHRLALRPVPRSGPWTSGPRGARAGVR